MDLKVLQINLDRVRAAHDLFSATAKNLDIDLAIIAEPNIKISTAEGWERDKRGDAAIVIYNKAITTKMILKGNGYLGLKLSGLTVYSCYFSPNCSIDQYKQDLDELKDSVRNQQGNILVAGDFNAASKLWGSKTTNHRGKYLMEILAELDLVSINTGNSPTFERGHKSSRPDVTLASSDWSGRVVNWKVLEDETMSGHKYISFDVCQEEIKMSPLPKGWNTRKINVDAFQKTINGEQISTPNELVTATTKACNQAMPRRKPGRRKQVYWWNDEIAAARRECIDRRRTYTRAMTKKYKKKVVDIDVEEPKKKYKVAKLSLQVLITKSRGNKWIEVCEALDNDVWGLGYKIVTRKLKRGPQIQIDIEQMRLIADVLFPTHNSFERKRYPTQKIPPVTKEEVKRACDRIKLGKAPGPDRIPPEIVKLAVSTIPDKITQVMNEVLQTGEYPQIWKVAILLLLRKAKKPVDDPTGYRPLCLLDCYGKLLERIILNRIETLLPDHGDLAEAQYGFRTGRSTLGAVAKVIDIAEAARQGTRRTKKLCALVALDVRNAFNSAPWEVMLEEFNRRNFPKYICNIINSYLQGRQIIVRDSEGKTTTLTVSSGVPQGSILGPTLWNILYDDILTTDFGDDVHLVGFADDLALVVAAHKEDVLMEKGNKALANISEWMTQRRLCLAPEKTEAIMLSGRRRFRPITFMIEGIRVEPKDKLRYLGVWFDRSLTFGKHVEEVSEKAERLTTVLSYLMPKQGGPRASKRRVLASVSHSVMLYAVPVWGRALNYAKYKNMLCKVQRQMAIRICGAYKTISLDAVLVIAGLVPIERLAMERTRMYNRENFKTPTEERKRTMEEWQKAWEKEGKGRWTRRLIPDLKLWIGRKHGEVDKYITQALSGHGVFNTYLHTIGKAASESCPYCGEVDTPEHAIFQCTVFEDKREEARGDSEHITPTNLVPRMLSSEEQWDACAEMMRAIIKVRIKDEWDRQKRVGA